jgi:hypothetical protein
MLNLWSMIIYCLIKWSIASELVTHDYMLNLWLMIICCLYVSVCMHMRLRIWDSLDQLVGLMFSFKLPINDHFQYISIRICSFLNNWICPVRFWHSHFHFRPTKKIWKWNWESCFSNYSQSVFRPKVRGGPCSQSINNRCCCHAAACELRVLVTHLCAQFIPWLAAQERKKMGLDLILPWILLIRKGAFLIRASLIISSIFRPYNLI